MNKKIVASSVSAVLMALPALMFAFNPGPVPSTATGLNIGSLIDILFSILWPIAVAFFIVMFGLAAFLFATAQGDPIKTKQARDAVIYGAIGVVVALLAWSIVFIIRNMIPGV